MTNFAHPDGPAAAMAMWCFLIAVGAVTASAAPNNDAYRASATGPNAGPIYQTLEVVRAPEPGRATAVVPALRTVFTRTIKRTDVVEAPRPGRGRM